MSDLGWFKFVMSFGVKWSCRVEICIYIWFRDEDGAGNIILEIISIHKL